MTDLAIFFETALAFLSDLAPVFFGILAYVLTRAGLQLYYGRRFEGPKAFAEFYNNRLSGQVAGLMSSTDRIIAGLRTRLDHLGGKQARMPLRVRIFFVFVCLSIVYTSVAFTASWVLVGSAVVGGITLFDSGYGPVERTIVSFVLVFLIIASVAIISWPNPYIATNVISRKLGGNWKETTHLKSLSPQDIDDVRGLVEKVPRQKVLFSLLIFSILPLCFSRYLGVQITSLYEFPAGFTMELGLFHATQVACLVVIWLSITPIVATTFMFAGATLMYVGFPIYLVSPLLLAVSIQVSGLLPIAVNSIFVPCIVLAFAYFSQSSDATLLVVIALMINLPVAVAAYSDIAVRGQGKLTAIFIALPSYIALTAILFFGQNQVNVGILHAIFVFWLMIPFANALWDSVSWLITWRLLRISERAFERQRDREKEPDANISDIYGIALVVFAFLVISLDILSALAFMVAISLSSILLVLLTNSLFNVVGLNSEMSADGILLKISEGRFFEADTSWLAVLVITTILPTVFHVFVASARIFSLIVERASIQYAAQQIADTNPDENYDRFDFYWSSAKNNVALIVSFSVAAVFFVLGVFFSVFQSNWYGFLLRHAAPVFGLE